MPLFPLPLPFCCLYTPYVLLNFLILKKDVQFLEFKFQIKVKKKNAFFQTALPFTGRGNGLRTLDNRQAFWNLEIIQI